MKSLLARGTWVIVPLFVAVGCNDDQRVDTPPHAPQPSDPTIALMPSTPDTRKIGESVAVLAAAGASTGGESVAYATVQTAKGDAKVAQGKSLGSTQIALIATYPNGSGLGPRAELKKDPRFAVAVRGPNARGVVMGPAVVLSRVNNMKIPKGAYKILIEPQKTDVEKRYPGLGVHVSADTKGVGVQCTAGFGYGIFGSVLYVWDDKGNSGLALSSGGGGYGGVTLNGGAVFEFTDAPDIFALNGRTSVVGVNAGCLGATYLIGSNYTGIDIGIGPGLSLVPAAAWVPAFFGQLSFSRVVAATTGAVPFVEVLPYFPGLGTPAGPLPMFGTPSRPIFQNSASPPGSVMPLPGFGPPTGPTMPLPGFAPPSGPTMYMPGFEPPDGPVMWLPGFN